MSPQPPLLPLIALPWWHNPYIVCTLFLAGTTMLVVGVWLWRRYPRRILITLSPRERWLHELSRLLKESDKPSFTTARGYEELMLLMRDYSATHHAIDPQSFTDEEVLAALATAPVPACEAFLKLFEEVAREAYQARFGHRDYPREHIQVHIKNFEQFLQQLQP